MLIDASDSQHVLVSAETAAPLAPSGEHHLEANVDVDPDGSKVVRRLEWQYGTDEITFSPCRRRGEVVQLPNAQAMASISEPDNGWARPCRPPPAGE